MRNDHPHSIAVIGAGIAGLAAARTLADRGCAVSIFDKGRRPGGRASSRIQDEFQWDHGAQYFTVRDERFAEFVRQWEQRGSIAEWKGRIAVVQDGSCSHAKPQRRFVGVPAMNALSLALAEDLPIRSGVRIDSIERRSAAWGLRDDAGNQLGEYDAVLLSAPAPQAARLLAEVPHLAALAGSRRMAPCWALLAAFRTAIDVPFDGAFIHESPLSWIARNNSKPGRPSGECWVLHGSPEWSQAHLEDEADDVVAPLLAAFFEACGTVSAPADLTIVHRWRYALPMEDEPLEGTWDDEAKIGVCGDWCHGSRIEGAFLSGLELAERVLCGADRKRD